MKLSISIFIFMMFAGLLASTLSYASAANECKSTQICLQVVVNNKSGEPLTDMVVYLAPLSGQILTPSTAIVEVGQLDKSFTPYLNVSQAKAKVNFINQDDITHHIYSADNKNKFSFKLRAGQTNSTTVFNQAAEIAMGCNIHDWMSGYLLVVDTPLFDHTNGKGQVSFHLSQPGDYRITVWHPQMQSTNHRISTTTNVVSNHLITMTLTSDMADVPKQKNDEDFDFLSDY